MAEKKAALRAALSGGKAKGLKAFCGSLSDSYWIAEDTSTQAVDFELVRSVRQKRSGRRIRVHTEWMDDAARVTVVAPGADGVFCRIAGALAGLRADILDAKIFTTDYGMAVDHFVVRPDDEVMFQTPSGHQHIAETISNAIASDDLPEPDIVTSQRRRKADLFQVAPFVLIDNKASQTNTVLEINARDRLGLLYDLAKVLLDRGVVIQSAHIATWGERAVDVFYVQEADGRRVTNGNRIKALKRDLLTAVGVQLAPKTPLSSPKRRGATAIPHANAEKG